LLSVLEDATKIAAAQAGSHDASTAIVLQDSANTTSSLSEKVLDNTINIPPTIYKLHGEVVGIYVAKDVDFSTVYELRTVAR
jgi:type IV secretion system protein VirB10